jgi:hypothetical protein
MGSVGKAIRRPIKAIEKPVKQLNKDLITRNFDRGRDFATDIKRDIEKPFRTGETGAGREGKRLSLLQTQREKARAAEATNEIAQRRGLASSGKGGRQSLIRSSNLGGS